MTEYPAQRCLYLREENVAIGDAAFTFGYKGGGRIPLERRNEVKKICLKCELKKCIFDPVKKRRKK